MDPSLTLFAHPFGAPLGLIAFAAGVFIVAGLVKGVVGLGLPTVAMALLALVMSPAQAAALLIVPSFVTNVWQCRPVATLGPMLKRLAPMQVGVVIGTLGASAVLGAPAGPWAGLALGIALIAYAGWGLVGAKFAVTPGQERWAGPLVGLITGAITAATGVFVIPAVPYLQALGLDRDQLVQAMGVSFTVSTVALAIGLSADGAFTLGGAGTSVLMLAPALIGMVIGQAIRERLSPAMFRRCLMIGLCALGFQMVLRAALAG